MITAPQLVAHAVGDYWLQSDWQAAEKTKRHLPAAVHALSYALPFLFLTRSPLRLALIAGTHFVIDRWRLGRLIPWTKNQLAPAPYRYPLSEAGPHGYRATRKDDWLVVWLGIIADNILHTLLNAVVLGWRR